VTDSVPVPLSGSNLKAHLIVNPLVLPLSSVPPSPPKLSGHPFCLCQKQQTYFYSHTPSPVYCLVPHLYLPSPPCAYRDPGLPRKTHAMVPYDFLKLLPHLMCHAPPSTATLNQLLGTSTGKGTTENCGHTTHTLTPLPQGKEGKQTGTPACPAGLPGCSSSTCHS
jgi:hypothetical protein